MLRHVTFLTRRERRSEGERQSIDMQPMMRYDEEEEDNDDHVSKDGLHFHLALLDAA